MIPRSLGDPSDGDLLDRMRSGDERALESLYARYGGLVYTLALRIVGDAELAREVLQDTFLRCWTSRESFANERGRVPWWLIAIARNRAIDTLRSRSHHARQREHAPLTERMRESPASDVAELIALRRAVTDALDGLTRTQRRAIELAYYGGLTQAEIARELSEPLDRLRRRLEPVVNANPEGGTVG